MTKKIQITSIAQAIELLKKAKEEYRELEQKYNKVSQELFEIKEAKKMPFDKLFGSFKK